MITIRVDNHRILINMLKHGWHPKLIELFLDVIIRYQEIPVITSAARDEGIHSMIPLRALDIRSYIYKDPEGVANDLNERWIYDPQRPKFKVAIFHDVGQGEHIHLQVHNNTILIQKV